jgi:hypothetical protein
MRIRLKEQITLKDGVSFPSGYELPCDAIVNVKGANVHVQRLTNQVGNVPVSETVMILGTGDYRKIEIVLE